METFFTKEPETLKWIDSFNDNKKIIFWDIGANIGLYSIYAALKHSDIEIISFEPSTSNLRILSRNISINKLEEKMKIHIGNSDIFRGYTPLGKEITNAKYDWHECVDFGPDLEPSHPEVIAGEQLVGPNQWPENQPNFREVLERHWNFTIVLGRMITEGMAMSLGLEKNFFAPYMSKSHSFMRIVNYPPYRKKQEENVGDGIGAHIDYGFLTILLQDNLGGLEVKNTDNAWLSAPIIPGTFLINIGHMIQRWTNDYYKATVHRVILPDLETRCSLPFFFEPNFDTVVVPLDEFCSKNNPPRYEPFHFGDYLENTFTTSYSDTVI